MKSVLVLTSILFVASGAFAATPGGVPSAVCIDAIGRYQSGWGLVAASAQNDLGKLQGAILDAHRQPTPDEVTQLKKLDQEVKTATQLDSEDLNAAVARCNALNP